MLSNIKGIIFDMDGTLIDSLVVWQDVWDAINEKYIGIKDFKPSEEIDKAVRTMTLRDAMEYIRKSYNAGESTDDILALVNDVVDEFYTNKVLMKKGVIEFLEYCRKCDIKMCIASGSALDSVKFIVKKFELEKYFCGMFSCADVGKGKDQPDVYLNALKCLGTKPEETAVFEDSHQAIITANKIGFKTVGIYDKYNYGFDEIKKIATDCVFENETLQKFIN